MKGLNRLHFKAKLSSFFHSTPYIVVLPLPRDPAHFCRSCYSLSLPSPLPFSSSFLVQTRVLPRACPPRPRLFLSLSSPLPSSAIWWSKLPSPPNTSCGPRVGCPALDVRPHAQMLFRLQTPSPLRPLLTLLPAAASNVPNPHRRPIPSQRCKYEVNNLRQTHTRAHRVTSLKPSSS